jgi:hypothetical protein
MMMNAICIKILLETFSNRTLTPDDLEYAIRDYTVRKVTHLFLS